MDLSILTPLFQDHLLSIVAVVITLVLIYHYMIEREHGVNLSKKYRDSIFEAQSKIFLNATQYLISGNKDLAIKEFLNAVDLNRETIETYFALGRLFRSNGEIDKAISIHRSLIARASISESTRLEALKELAIDFDKGGFLDKAIETYKDVLKINRDQFEVIQSLCRIYEDIGEWDEAYNYRIMLSKVAHENQSETISHILVEKAKKLFTRGEYKRCREDLDDAFRFAPSVSAKILHLKIQLVEGKMEEAKAYFVELLKEHPIYISFIMESLEDFNEKKTENTEYREKLGVIKNFFLDLNDKELNNFPSVVLSKVRLLKSNNRVKDAYNLLNIWLDQEGRINNDALNIEYIKLLIEIGEEKKALVQTQSYLSEINKTLTKHFCSHCGFNSDEIFWRCQQCHKWETIQFRWKV